MRRRDFIAGLGSAAAWSLVARAQQSAMPVIGYLSGNTEIGNRPAAAAFRKGLGEEGFVEGWNVEILYWWAETQYDRLPALANDLVRRRVSVIVATSVIGAARAAKSATATIPIVFQTGLDPVESGLVASLNRPGGNITGIFTLGRDLAAKRLELLRESVPAASSIGVLLNPSSIGAEPQMKAMEIAARVLGLRLVILNASTPGEIDAVFATVVGERVGALMTDADPLFFTQGAQLAALAARHRVPMIHYAREMVDAGGLMSYGVNVADAYRLVGKYAGRILKGDKPADLPVQQATKVELVLNMKTAKALGFTFPLNLLGRADEVIE